MRGFRVNCSRNANFDQISSSGIGKKISTWGFSRKTWWTGITIACPGPLRPLPFEEWRHRLNWKP